MSRMMTGLTRRLNNVELLDEVHNEITRMVQGLPGVGGEAYMKKAVNVSRHENYLVLYDKYGNTIGRLTVQGSIVVAAHSYRGDIDAILKSFVGCQMSTERSNRDDLVHGRPVQDCWL